MVTVHLHSSLPHFGFPGGSVVKIPPASAGDAGSIPGLGRSPGEGNGHPLQFSCLGNPMDRGAWWAAVMGSQRVRHGWVTKYQQLPHLPELFRGLAGRWVGGGWDLVEYLHFYILNWIYVGHLLRVPITIWVNRLLNIYYLQHCYANELTLLSLFYRWKNWASEMLNNFVS